MKFKYDELINDNNSMMEMCHFDLNLFLSNGSLTFSLGPIAILDPDGLRREVDHWRSEVAELRRKNYDLEVMLGQVKNERKMLQIKLRSMTKAR